MLRSTGQTGGCHTALEIVITPNAKASAADPGIEIRYPLHLSQTHYLEE